jgi:hypothetical protein
MHFSMARPASCADTARVPVTTEFFQTIGAPLISGRMIQETENTQAAALFGDLLAALLFGRAGRRS